jgi:pyruvate, water dikinase
MDAQLNAVPLAEARDERVFGRKAVSLGMAVRAGLLVPCGIAVSAALVEGAATGAPAVNAIVASAASIGAKRMAVRSSAIGEDVEGMSFAGRHETVLNVAASGLADAVRRVWESARTPAALAFRRRRGLTAPPALGVVIQELVEPVAAGVLFTRDPVTGANERLIEAAWGLGDAVVSGLVIPDRYRLDASGGVLEIESGNKDVKISCEGEQGIAEVPVAPELHRALCLRANHLARLHALAERCCATWGPDLDIEWALATDGRIYLLQLGVGSAKNVGNWEQP